MNSQDVLIDYVLLAEAIKYYKDLGYTQIEVPWIVDKDISMMTCPHEDNAFKLNNREHLVGSAEQGFLQILKNNPDYLEYDKFYFAVSPCFRNETQDELHSFYFMKIELFLKRKNDQLSWHLHYNILLDAARTLFNNLLNVKNKVAVYLTLDETTCDLVYNGVELGSYGIRKYNEFQYLYGTGLALPRFTIAKEIKNDKEKSK